MVQATTSDVLVPAAASALDRDSVANVGQIGPVTREFVDTYPAGHLAPYLMAQIGTRTQAAQYAADLSTSIAKNLESDRTAVSGVNLDEEAGKLIQYQQAYQASAKMLQIAQSIFDSLIQTMGR